MTAYRKIGSIKNLEIVSVCNLACPYCPAHLQGEHRETGLMTDETFDRSMYWLQKFVKAGTQRELNLFGVGEPLLHPRVVEFAAAARRIIPGYLAAKGVTLRMNTNGILLTEENLRALFDAGIDSIDLTDHEAKASMMAIRTIRKVTGQWMPSQGPGSKWGYSRDGILAPNNWGGLIDWTPDVQYQRYVCPWLSGGCVMIMSDGSVTRCCQDAFARGLLGHVRDELDKIDHTPFLQCRTCHEDVPAGMPYPNQEKEIVK